MTTITSQVEILEERIQLLRAALVLEHQASVTRARRAAAVGLVAGAAIGLGIGYAVAVRAVRPVRTGNAANEGA